MIKDALDMLLVKNIREPWLASRKKLDYGGSIEQLEEKLSLMLQ